MSPPKVTLIIEDIDEPASETGKGVAIEVQVDGSIDGEMSTAEAVASSAFSHAVDLLEKASLGAVEFEQIGNKESNEDLN